MGQRALGIGLLHPDAPSPWAFAGAGARLEDSTRSKERPAADTIRRAARSRSRVAANGARPLEPREPGPRSRPHLAARDDPERRVPETTREPFAPPELPRSSME